MILVLGGGGMLGHKIYQALSGSSLDVRCTFRGSTPNIPLFKPSECIEDVDVDDLAASEELVRDTKAKWLINCVGVIKQRPEATDPVLTIQTNSLLPHLLAEWQSNHGGRLLHFSTDCVFSGSRGHYSENDAPDANDLYGRSKLLGETRAENALTLRTSIIGRELSNCASMVEWFLSNRGGRVQGYTKVIYSGVTTNWMSRAVKSLIESETQLSGVYQLSSPPIAKYDLLMQIKDAMNLDIQIEPFDGVVNDKSLTSMRFWADSGLTQPGWSEMIEEMAADPTPYDEWRT